MEKQNGILSLPKNILNKLKHITVDKNKSISELLTKNRIEIIYKNEAYQTAKTRQLFMMECGLDMGYGKVDWKREDLHNRL